MLRHLLNLSIPIALIFVSAILLVQDFRREEALEHTEESPLASAISISGDVKRKPKKRMLWFSVKTSQNLFRQDTVRTVQNSSAVIEIEGGGRIELGENSMIVLERSKDRVAIDFVSGNIFSKGGGKGLVVRSQGMDLDVGNAKVELKRDKAGAASINVQEGKITVAAEGKQVTIAENQMASITQEGVGEVEDIPVKLLAPDRNALVFTGEEHALLDFKWESLKPLNDSVLEVSADSDFRTLVKSISAKSRSLVTSVKLAKGVYHWRVRSQGSSLTESRRMEIQEKVPIRLINPPQGHRVRFAKVAPRMIFRWLGPDYFETYTLEIAADSQFKTLLKTEEVEGDPQAAVELDHNGEIFWRVRGKSERIQIEDSSPVGTFALSKLDRLEPPEPLSPPPGSTIASGKDASTVQLRWNAIEGATEYQVEIAADEGFSDILEKLKTPRNQTQWTARSIGRYFWRVSVYDLDGEYVESRQGRDFIIVSSVPVKILKPQDGFTIRYRTEIPEIPLEWEEDGKIRTYQIELARDLAFTDRPRSFKTEDSEYTLTPKELTHEEADGQYFWKVKGLDAEGRVLRVSGINRFELKFERVEKPLPSTEVESPESGEILQLGESDNPLLKWKAPDIPQPDPAPGSRAPAATESIESYEVTLRATDGKGGVRKLKSITPELSLKNLPPGKYTWTVQYITSRGRRSPTSEARSIELKEVAAIPVPSIFPVIIESTVIE